jgi:hypothetical protein
MKNAYWAEIVSAAALLGIIELYLWTQSGAEMYEGNTIKVALIALYFFAAALSGYGISAVWKFSFRDALNVNICLSVAVSVAVTCLAFSFHGGLAKDVDLGWMSFIEVLLGFLFLIGLGTFVAKLFGWLIARTFRQTR